MIQEFKVKNFLSFNKEQVLSFEPTSDSYYEDKYCIQVTEDVRLLKAAYIYGANGSGKSNLLFALNFLSALASEAQSDNDEETGVMPFMLNDTSSKQSTSFSIIFYIEEKKYIYEVELNKNIILYESLVYYPSTRPARLYNRKFDHNARKSIIEFGNQVKLTKKEILIITGNTLNNTSVLATLSKVNVGITILNNVQNYFKDTILNILQPSQDLIGKYAIKKIESDSGLKSFVLELLNKSGFNICDLRIEEEVADIPQEMRDFFLKFPYIDDERRKIFLEKDKIEHKDLLFLHKTSHGIHSLKADVQSRGTLRYLGMLVLLYDLIKRNNVMLIDEIESSLHYTLLRDFIRLFIESKESQSQLIFTTHDLNILDEDFIRRDVIWFTEKNIDGETTLERLSSKGIHKNVSIYNAYKKGRI